MPRRPGRATRSAAAALAALIGLAALTGACSDDEPDAESFCDELRQAPSLAAVLTGFADQDPTQLRRRLDDAETQYRDLRDTAPEEIRPDVEQTVDLVDAAIAAVRADSDDPAAAATSIRKVIDDHPEAETAGLAVADYARQQCQVELNPSSGAGDEPTDAPDGAGDEDGDGTVPPAAEGDDGSVTGGM